MSLGASWRGRHLVEQRLELVVVVAVEQRDAHVVLRGQPRAQPTPAKPPPTTTTWRCPLASSGGMRGLPPRRPRADAARARWSPTRSAFAIAVSAGFTAPMLGKKLVSTT